MTTLAEKLRFEWGRLPYVCQNVAGTGGQIRQETTDFQVEEMPLYLPEGKGSHSYAFIEKRNMSTRDVFVKLLDAGIPERSIGVAGLKDKAAVARQWMSVPRKYEDALKSIDDLENVKILELSRHKNKLAIGHLTGNRFKLRVRGSVDEAMELARASIEVIDESGMPNFFGPQRFGIYGNNAMDGYKILKGERVPGGRQLKRFFISSLQSALFNQNVCWRLERGHYASLLSGDWAKKHDTGGEFEVKELEVELPRATNNEISALLPLYGKKIKIADGDAGRLEHEVLDHFEIDWDAFTGRRGARRITRVFPKDIELTAEEDGYTVAFSLPKGAFATVFMREIMKVDVDGPRQSDVSKSDPSKSDPSQSNPSQSDPSESPKEAEIS